MDSISFGGSTHIVRTAGPLIGPRNQQAADFAGRWITRRFLGVIVSGLLLVLFTVCEAEQIQPEFQRTPPPAPIVVGFVGGFVHADDLRRSEVQLADRLRADYGDRVRVAVFENRQRARAHAQILHWLSRDTEDISSTQKEIRTPIILFGHSWGASAVITLARELQQEGISVALTIQVDSVSKNGETVWLVPANVAEAANFYQRGGILHGSEIRAADPSRTNVVRNSRLRYEQMPSSCRRFPWYQRLVSKGHNAIECDPSVWFQIETLIRTRMNAHVQRAAMTLPEATIIPGKR